MFSKYLIKDGDTIEAIASKFNTDAKTIMDINNIYFMDEIKSGRELIVPKNSDLYFNTYVIEKGDSLYKIAEKYNINPTLLGALNGIDMQDYIYPDQEIIIPKGGYSYYITKDGDTIDIVSDVFKIKNLELLNQNKTIYLMPGQVLVAKR